MSRNRQVAISSSVDLTAGDKRSFASYQLKKNAGGYFVANVYVSTLGPDGHARLFSAATIDLSGMNTHAESDLLQQLHSTIGDGVFRLISLGLGTGDSALPLSGFDEARGIALAAHLQHFEKQGSGMFQGNVLEQTAARYVLAKSFGAPTVQEYLASYDGVTVSAIKGRLHRAKKEGLIEFGRDDKATDRGTSDAG